MACQRTLPDQGPRPDPTTGHGSLRLRCGPQGVGRQLGELSLDEECPTEDACRIAYGVAARGGHLEDLLRELASFTIDGRRAAVVDAQRRCHQRAADDADWERASTLLQHAIETGPFHDRR